jgi:bifunctional UDP-N-acetylglucosamine pyrophosphorylase/glucosamine-1-phosphate N-acetyltransferase
VLKEANPPVPRTQDQRGLSSWNQNSRMDRTFREEHHMEGLTTIILAAGAGTRMKSDKAKCAHEVAGLPMLGWVMRAARDAGATENIVVVGHHAEEIEALVPEGTRCVLQAERLGTGHAVQCAAEALPGACGTILVLCGDTPLLRGQTLARACEAHRETGHAATVLTGILENPKGYGRILREADGQVAGIVEQADATEQQQAIQEINTGVYLFDAAALLAALPKLKNNNRQGEYYLTDVLGILREAGRSVGAHVVPDAEETFGVNDRVQLAQAEAVLLGRIRNAHMLAGATFRLPETSWIGADVRIGEDTLILPGCILEGKTEIGAGCVIGPNTRMVDARVEAGVEVAQSVILSSSVGNGTKVGPFAYLRPGSQVGRHVKIGDFVEIKKSVIGDNTKISHLTYVGDAEVGERVNLGCGVVVVNYDGRVKNRTVIGDDSFVGCNVNLISPVEVHDHAYVAAGSTITSEVPSYALGIARARQTVKEEWVRKKGLDKPKET